MRYYCCFYSVNHLGLLVLPWMECQVITDYPLLQVPTSPLSFCQFALTVPQYLCIPDDLGQFTNVDNLTIKSLCLLLCDKLLCLCSLPDGFYQQQQFYGGYPPRGGGRGYGNPGMYYGRGGGNTWRDRGPSRAPTNGKYGLYYALRVKPQFEYQCHCVC